MLFSVFTITICVEHDANHNAFSKSQRVNGAFGYSLNFIGGSFLLASTAAQEYGFEIRQAHYYQHQQTVGAFLSLH